MDAPIPWIQEQVIDAATVNLQQRVVERGVDVWSISGVGVSRFFFLRASYEVLYSLW